MPHDSILGEYSAEFAGRLGIIELSSGKTAHGEGFAGALEIIDSDSLRKLLDSDGRQRVDARALLKARLMDLFLNDNDRHPGQWRWARMQKGHASPWEPIPRDRDQVFVAYRGAFLAAARFAAPNLLKFDGNINLPGLTYNSLEMDRRLLSGLERPVWDSIANDLTTRLTDAVIDSAVRAMPAEYHWWAPALAATLRLRREHLKTAATTFYLYLSGIVDVHGTDAGDRLTVTREPNGLVDVRLETAGDDPFFARRFDFLETRDIRVYLHGGNDTSIVRGDVRESISVKIIGGNGINWLTDSSRVDGRANPTELIDTGTVTGVTYGKDTLFDRFGVLSSSAYWRILRDDGSFVDHDERCDIAETQPAGGAAHIDPDLETGEAGQVKEEARHRVDVAVLVLRTQRPAPFLARQRAGAALQASRDSPQCTVSAPFDRQLDRRVPRCCVDVPRGSTGT